MKKTVLAYDLPKDEIRRCSCCLEYKGGRVYDMAVAILDEHELARLHGVVTLCARCRDGFEDADFAIDRPAEHKEAADWRAEVGKYIADVERMLDDLCPQAGRPEFLAAFEKKAREF